MSRQESEKFIEEARLLLPWYLTNTLSDEEQDLVNRALEASPELRKEFVREEKMMRLVKENTSLLELSALDTTEQRLENTLARIEREEQAELAEEADSVLARQPLVAKIKDGWFNRLFRHKLLDIEWLTPANAAFASLLAVQVGVLSYYQLNRDTLYETVTVAELQKTPAENVKRLIMGFQADAQYGEVCDFLVDWNAKIVAGPDNTNGFIVEMSAADSQADVDAIINEIMSKASGDKGPVEFVGSKFPDEVN